MENICVILCRTKYSENIGSVARACVNMGCSEMILVDPKELDLNKALPLATPKGKHVLERAKVVSNLSLALEDFNKVYGTTARVGGWRKRVLLPKQAAVQIAEDVKEGRRVAIVFGPEDTGLLNEEIEQCGQLITIPTDPGAWSLNISQAVLIILYECFNKISYHKWNKRNLEKDLTQYATHKDLELLYESIKQVLKEIDFLIPQNPDYFMLPIKRFIHRINLKKNEFNMLMGVCRQLLWYFNKRKL